MYIRVRVAPLTDTRDGIMLDIEGETFALSHAEAEALSCDLLKALREPSL